MPTISPAPSDVEHVRSLLPELSLIRDPRVAEAVATIWAYLWRASQYEQLEDAPVSPDLRKRRLIDQVRCVTMIAVDTARRLKEYHGIETNQDHVVAAGLLLDASKLVEYFPDDADVLARTRIRNLLPHSYLSAEAARQLNLPDEIVHLVLYHTPRVLLNPSMVEAIVLQGADLTAVDCLYFDSGKLTARLRRDPEAGNIK
jgi:hypothetical protein